MQQITPIEIRQKSFEKSFRGYNRDEVDAFLHALAYVWEKLMTQLDECSASLESNRREVQRLQAIENALLQTIKDGEIAAHSITKQAQKEAELRVREAQIEADKLICEAREKIETMEVDSQKTIQHLKEQMELELLRTKKMIQEAETYRDILLQKVRHLAEDILARSQLIESDSYPCDVYNNENSKKGAVQSTLLSESDPEKEIGT